MTPCVLRNRKKISKPAGEEQQLWRVLTVPHTARNSNKTRRQRTTKTAGVALLFETPRVETPVVKTPTSCRNTFCRQIPDEKHVFETGRCGSNTSAGSRTQAFPRSMISRSWGKRTPSIPIDARFDFREFFGSQAYDVEEMLQCFNSPRSPRHHRLAHSPHPAVMPTRTTFLAILTRNSPHQT